MNCHYKFAEFISTICYIGKIKFAPGTFGSLPAFPLCYIIMHFILTNQIIFQIPAFNTSESQFLSLLIIETLITIILFIIGLYFTAIYIKNMEEKDPKEVVIDELVGQMLTIIFSSPSIIFLYSSALPQKISSFYINSIFLFLLPFILFRLFDIIKPWPINWLDKNIKGAIGVMIDDVGAALFAITTQYIIIFCILEFYHL